MASVHSLTLPTGHSPMGSGSQREPSGEAKQVVAGRSQPGRRQKARAQEDMSCTPVISATVSQTQITHKCPSGWSTTAWNTVCHSGASRKKNLGKWSIS